MSSCHCIEGIGSPKDEHLGKILLADDEEIFLYATAELLRDEGYHCDCAHDAVEAVEKLRRAPYDVLITDIKMPGNPHLELITEVQRIAAALPVIVVTGYPSLDSAIDAIHLPVAAYLVKPVEFERLRSTVAQSVQRSKAHRAVCGTQHRLTDWSEEIGRVKQLLEQPAKCPSPQVIEAFVAGTLLKVVESLTELQRLAGLLAGHRQQPEQRWICNVARAGTIVELLRETVEVLERTKHAFKSKQLGQLRHRLQVVLDQWDND